jgi:hypothetical protein
MTCESIRAGSGLGPNIIGGTRLYKGHRDMAEKISHFFKKASIPLKMNLKSLTNP